MPHNAEGAFSKISEILNTNMDLNKFTIRSQQAIQQAQTIATGLGQQQIETGHLLKGLLEVDQDVTPFLLKKLNVNTATLLSALDLSLIHISEPTRPY